MAGPFPGERPRPARSAIALALLSGCSDAVKLDAALQLMESVELSNSLVSAFAATLLSGRPEVLRLEAGRTILMGVKNPYLCTDLMAAGREVHAHGARLSEVLQPYDGETKPRARAARDQADAGKEHV